MASFPDMRADVEIKFGVISIKIVGVQYYAGVVHDREMVKLAREPESPYDSNAIRVENVSGVKVGHVSRAMAAVLAPLLDEADPYKALSVNCVVPSRGFNKYEMEASCTLYGRPGNAARVSALLRRGKVKVANGVCACEPAKVYQAALAQASAQLAATSTVNDYRGTKSSEALDDHAAEKELAERLAVLEGDHTSERLVEAGLLATPLMAHQRVGVAWMLSKEADPAADPADKAQLDKEAKGATSGSARGFKPAPAATVGLPALWERRVEHKQGVYFSHVTNSSRREPPHLQKGGLLADEMGLGKTLQVLAVVAASRLVHSTSASGQSGGGEGLKATLVVAPSSVVDSWVTQCRLHTPTLKVAAYTGGSRDASTLGALDVVVTTYGTIQAEWKAAEEAAAAAVAAAAAAAVTGPTDTEAVAAAAVAACDEASATTSKGKKPRKKKSKATAAALQGATGAAGGDAGGLFGFAAAGGLERLVLDEAHTIRNRQTKTFKAVMALATRADGGALLAAEVPSSNTPPAASPAAPAAAAAVAAAVRRPSASGVVRWALTGTVLQNSSDDCFAVLAFLRCEPLEDWPTFQAAVGRPVAAGEPRGLDLLRRAFAGCCLRRKADILAAQLPPRRTVVAKVSLDFAFTEGGGGGGSGGGGGLGFGAISSSAAALTAANAYAALAVSATAVVRALAAAGDKALLAHYSSVLECILRLRQCCCAVELIPAQRLARAVAVAEALAARCQPLAGAGGAAAAAAASSGTEDDEILDLTCGTQDDKGLDLTATAAPEAQAEGAVPVMTAEEAVALLEQLCGQEATPTPAAGSSSLDAMELIDGDDGGNGATTPLRRPREQLGGKDGKDDDDDDDGDDEDWTPAHKETTTVAAECGGGGCGAARFEWERCPKVATLVGALKAQPVGEKAVVFSQFTKMLGLVGQALAENGLTFALLTGAQPPKRRAEAVRALQSDHGGGGSESVDVLLVSLMAGGVGLTLTRANHAYLLDPWWNSAAEEQAAARIHRIGQTRACTVTKFVVAQSIEERILMLQERKAALGKGALQKLTDEELRKTRSDNIKSLFLD